MLDATQRHQYLIEQLNGCAQGDRNAFERLYRASSIDWLRGQKPQNATADEPLLATLLGADDPEDDSISHEQNDKLNDCLDTLSHHQRQLMEMAYFQGMTHSELASSLSQPLGSVKSWIRRGLERLKTCLTNGI